MGCLSEAVTASAHERHVLGNIHMHIHQMSRNPLSFLLTHTVARCHTPFFCPKFTPLLVQHLDNQLVLKRQLTPVPGVGLFVVTTLHVRFQIQPMWAVTCEAPPPGWLPASPKVRESNKKPCCPPPSTPKLSVSVPLEDVPRK